MPAGEANFSWNKKILDYEIETLFRSILHRLHFSWNKKILDYEIETQQLGRFQIGRGSVEIRRFSITRLKLYMVSLTAWKSIELK